MKFSRVPCLLAALYSASFALANAMQEPAAAVVADQPAATPEPALVDDAQPNLELRQATVVDSDATTAVAQYPSITTQWLETEIDGTSTWAEFIYTQTFASIPDQWFTAGKGTIGYGTLTKAKRDVIVPRETGYAQAVVLELQHEIVTQFVRPVTEILVIETITILPNMTYAGGMGNMTYNSTATGTGNPNDLRNHTLPASLDPMAHHLPTGAALF